MGSVRKDGIDINYGLHTFWSGWWVTLYTGWENDTFNIFARFLNEESVVLDIGAWAGPTALWAAYRAKTVIAVEPSPRAFFQLWENLQANPALA